MLNSRFNRLFFGFLLALLIELLFIAGFSFSADDGWAHRFFLALGGDFLKGGYIQMTTYWTFFWGMFEMAWFLQLNRKEKKYFSYEILPEEEFAVLDASQVNKVRIKVADYLRDHRKDQDRKFYLLRVINKACIKFRANFSIPETFQVVTSQCRINATKAESNHSFIRYVAWAIPALGFIGTVLGISQALGIASSGDIDKITSTLAIAFDTTLVALILSLILMFFIHQLQEDTEKLHTNIEEYVVDKLVNRIDVN